MPNYRIKYPKILWGAAFANTLSVGYWLDNVSAWSEPRAGSDSVQAPSGVEDAWTVATDFYLAGEITFIPPTDTVSPVATGWDGLTGVRAFLEWVRDKNVFKFYPDASDPTTHIDGCYLVDPMNGEPTPEADGTRRIRLKIRNATSSFDGY